MSRRERRDDLRVGSEWSSLRLEVGVDGKHGVRQPLHARIVAVWIGTPRYGRKRHVFIDVERLDGPSAGIIEEWTVDKFVNLWTARSDASDPYAAEYVHGTAVGPWSKELEPDVEIETVPLISEGIGRPKRR